MNGFETNLSRRQVIVLVILRVLIGWHLFYEGITKLTNPNWSSIAYLMDSKGFLAGFFHSLAQNDQILNIVDFLNVWGLIMIGLGLILGAFTRFSLLSGIILLSLYYLSHPPFATITYDLPTTGNFLVIDKNLIEIFAMAALLLFPTGKIIGMDRLINHFLSKQPNNQTTNNQITQ